MLMHLLLSDIPHLRKYKIERWSTISVDDLFTSTELLDQHQEVLDTPSGSNTSPQRLQ